MIGAYFYPSVIQDIFDFKSINSTFTTNYDVTKIKMDSVLKNFRASIDFLLENPEIADEELVLTKLKEFILLLSKTENAPSVLDFISSLFISPQYDFKKVIENNLYTNFSLDEIAKMCNCSISTFKRKFIEIYNESPAKYIVKQKILKSYQLLENKQERITNIAYDCGFESVSTFNRVFKKQTGKSPSEYRTGLN